MGTVLGWTLLALAAMLVALGIWDLPQPAGPPLPAGEGLLEPGATWYLRAGYLAVAAGVAALGAWLLLRGRRGDGGVA